MTGKQGLGKSESGKARRHSLRWIIASLVLVVAVLASTAAAEPGAEPEGNQDSGGQPQGVEIPDLRTATSDTFLLPGGQRETRLYQSSVNYRDEDGGWEPIDESLDETAAGGLTNAANSFDLQLPEQMGAGSVRLSQDGQWLSYRLLGAQTGEAEVEDGTAVYDSAGGDLSFELHSLANGLKEEIVLADNSQPRRYSFALDFSDGLTPTLAEDGSIEVEDPEGVLFATLPAPTISDASGAPPSDAVHYDLQEGSDAGTWTLAVEADEAWLSDPDRAWPVTIDPSAFFATEQDCSVGSTPLPAGWSACGAGGSKELITAYSQIEKQPVRTFLRFNIGKSIPWDSYISKAVMKLWAPKAAENTVSGLETRRVTQNWNTTLNWQRYKEGGNWSTPGGDFTSEGLAQAAQPGNGFGWWEFSSSSLRELVERWVERTRGPGPQNGPPGSLENQGLVVKQIDETRTAECESGGSCARRWVTFNSSAASSNKPELDVFYFPKAPSTNKMISPSEGTTTARRLQLRAQWAAGVSGVSFQYRAGKTGPFKSIPSALLRNAKGEAVEELAVSESCCQSQPVYFDAAHINSELQSKGGVIQVRAIFEGGTGAGFSVPVEAKVDRYLGGPKDETTSVGPGTLDLLTGNLSLGESDVSIGGFNPLSFSRSYNTRVPGTTGEKTILGQGWTSGAELAGGSEWASLKVTNGSEEIEGETYTFAYATVTDTKGKGISFEKVGGNYLAPAELTGYALALNAEGKFILTAPGGTKTTFSNESSGNGSEYLPISVTQPGSGPHSTVTTWNFVNGQKRLVRQVAPTASKSAFACEANPTTTTGCRTLDFTYAPATKWGAPSTYGDRLEKITFFAPGEGGPWEVAAYSYDNLGRLVSEWDPRIIPNLKSTYTYEGNKMRTVKPPGQEPWTLRYTTAALDGESGTFRIKGVERPNLLSGVTMTSIRYEVPLSGSGAAYAMNSSSVATWGQADLPTDATAVFPPTEVPAEPASSYAKATLFYMDSEGFGVNTATPAGAGTSAPSITTTEADEFGNITRELSAQNRLRALAEPEGKKAERSHLLESKFTYSSDGTKLLDERGPLHQVKLQEGGEVAEARLHRTIAYDNPANLNPAPLVPTREVTGAIFPSKGTEADQLVTETKYDWSLVKPVETITDAGVGHLNIKKKAAYDETTGLPIETRQPKASEESGAVPGATITTYWTSSPPNQEGCTNGGQWSGLPCKIAPAAQPEGTPLPITWIKSYSPLGKPTEIVQEVPGAGEAGIRKTVIHYDDAGRMNWKKVTGGGQSVPKVEYLYSSSNGMPTTQKFVCEVGECAGFDSQPTTTNYDALGRVKSFEDADGNKAETIFDSYGRPSSFTDNKGSQTMGYDPATGLLTKLTDSAAGVFTAIYDADGKMVKRGLPNGLTAEAIYDSTGAAVGLTYTKASSCGSSCTWLSFGIDPSIYGQTLSETGTLGTNRYSYDRAGRLVEAQGTPTGGNCTVRSYNYDKDSNRLSKTTIAATLGGVCGTGSPSEKKYSYDKVDRLNDSGVVHDNFGRITTLPASDAGGQSLTTSYFATNMIATQSQGGVTNTFELDAIGRQRSRLQGGAGLEGIEVLHYNNLGDSAAWSERGSAWTRNIVGIGGELAAVQESGKEITLPLTNLHGDVVATAAINPEVTALKGTFAYDEFGNPTSGASGRYGWLGGMQRRTELPSGVVQMGARSYVPTIGRFLSPDPIDGGSANAYDYGNADPVNQFDPTGMAPYGYDSACDPGIVGCQVKLELWMWSPRGGRMGVRMRWRTNRGLGGIKLESVRIDYWVDEPMDLYKEGFVKMDPPHYLNNYPGLPADCRGTDPCAENHDASGTFACKGGSQYQIQLTIKYFYNQGAGAGEEQLLEVKAQMGCKVPY